MNIKVVKYGRTVDLGRFGRGPVGKTWFGWEAEVEEGQTPHECLAALKALADIEEQKAHEDFAKRTQRSFEG